MREDFKKGVKMGAILYGAGVLLTLIVHQMYGWNGGHGPPISFLAVALTIIVALLRLLYTLGWGKNKEKNRGEIVVHLVVFVTCILIVQISIRL